MLLYAPRIQGVNVSVVISVRVPKWLKEKLEKYRVNIAEVVRKSLMEEVERLEREDLERQLDALRETIGKRIDPYELANLVDEERQRR